MAGKPAAKAATSLRVLSVARATNVSIMLTRFADFEGGASALQKALLTGTTFTAEQLSLLLQVWHLPVLQGNLHAVLASNSYGQ